MGCAVIFLFACYRLPIKTAAAKRLGKRTFLPLGKRLG
jgi:hypothetical protein